MESIAKMKVIKRTNVPRSAEALPMKELFTRKIDNVKKQTIHKSRFVVRGDLQQEKPLESYAPVISQEAVRTFLTKVVQEDLKLMQADISTAFLYGRNPCTLYLRLPEGHPERNTSVWMTNSSVYGLTNAPLIWFKTLTEYLEENGFIQELTEPCLMKKLDVEKTYIAIYVDDLLYASNSETRLKELENLLRAKFNLKTTNEVKEYLGMKIKRHQGVIQLSQIKKINKIATSIGSNELREVETPLANNIFERENDVPANKKQYQALVG